MNRLITTLSVDLYTVSFTKNFDTQQKFRETATFALLTNNKNIEIVQLKEHFKTE